jgi:hypothetical protein
VGADRVGAWHCSSLHAPALPGIPSSPQIRRPALLCWQRLSLPTCHGLVLVQRMHPLLPRRGTATAGHTHTLAAASHAQTSHTRHNPCLKTCPRPRAMHPSTYNSFRSARSQDTSPQGIASGDSCATDNQKCHPCFIQLRRPSV